MATVERSATVLVGVLLLLTHTHTHPEACTIQTHTLSVCVLTGPAAGDGCQRKTNY